MSVQFINDKEKLQQIRNQINYDSLSSWGKFFYGYKSTIRVIGIKAIWIYPLTYYKLWKLTSDEPAKQ